MLCLLKKQDVVKDALPFLRLCAGKGEEKKKNGSLNKIRNESFFFGIPSLHVLPEPLFSKHWRRISLFWWYRQV